MCLTPALLSGRSPLTSLFLEHSRLVPVPGLYGLLTLPLFITWVSRCHHSRCHVIRPFLDPYPGWPALRPLPPRTAVIRHPYVCMLSPPELHDLWIIVYCASLCTRMWTLGGQEWCRSRSLLHPITQKWAQHAVCTHLTCAKWKKSMNGQSSAGAFSDPVSLLPAICTDNERTPQEV